MTTEDRPSYDASDPETERHARSEETRRRRADADVLRKLMFTREGRDWLYRRLESCDIYGNSFVPGEPDTTAFRLGQQNIGKQLMVEAIDASADLYVKMVNEQKEEEKRLAKVMRDLEERKKTEGGFVEDEPMPSPFTVPDLPPPEGWTGPV